MPIVNGKLVLSRAPRNNDTYPPDSIVAVTVKPTPPGPIVAWTGSGLRMGRWAISRCWMTSGCRF